MTLKYSHQVTASEAAANSILTRISMWVTDQNLAFWVSSIGMT